MLVSQTRTTGVIRRATGRCEKARAMHAARSDEGWRARGMGSVGRRDICANEGGVRVAAPVGVVRARRLGKLVDAVASPTARVEPTDAVASPTSVVAARQSGHVTPYESVGGGGDAASPTGVVVVRHREMGSTYESTAAHATSPTSRVAARQHDMRALNDRTGSSASAVAAGGNVRTAKEMEEFADSLLMTEGGARVVDGRALPPLSALSALSAVGDRPVLGRMERGTYVRTETWYHGDPTQESVAPWERMAASGARYLSPAELSYLPARRAQRTVSVGCSFSEEVMLVEPVKVALPASGGVIKARRTGRFACPECEVVFRQTGNLRKHVAEIHEKSKPFRCNVCGNHFSRKHARDTHLKAVHHKLRPFECSICLKRYKNRSDLNKHMRTVERREKPHVCAVCNRAFGERGKLKRHMAIHDRRPAAH